MVLIILTVSPIRPVKLLNVLKKLPLEDVWRGAIAAAVGKVLLDGVKNSGSLH
jgi:hypothetical protein